MPFDANAIGATLKKIPWWGYAGGGGVALALAYYIKKQMHGTPAPGQPSAVPTTSGTVDQGLQVADLAGLPYETFDPGYSSDPYSYYNQYNPSGYQPVTVPPSGSPPPTEDTTGNPVTNPSPGLPPVIPQSPNPDTHGGLPNPNSAGQSITYPGGETIPAGGKGYTFTGKPGIHLWNVAQQEYGTASSNAAIDQIIAANPSLSGKSYTYVPPAGTRIIIPQLSGTGHGGEGWHGLLHAWPDWDSNYGSMEAMVS